MDNKLLLGGLVAIFVVFLIINRVSAKLGYKPIEKITTEAGIGSLLAGTFIGVVREVLLKRQPDQNLSMIVMIMFFMWYVLTKGLAVLFVEGGFENLKGKPPQGQSQVDNKKEDAVKSVQPPPLPEMYQVFVVAIIIFLVIILIVSFYAQRKEGSDKHIVNFNIIMTFLVILAGFFTFITGKKIEPEQKIRILSYTISFVIAFGIFVPIFVTKNFTFASLIITTLIFFVWITLTFSFANFSFVENEYIKRS